MKPSRMTLTLALVVAAFAGLPTASPALNVLSSIETFVKAPVDVFVTVSFTRETPPGLTDAGAKLFATVRPPSTVSDALAAAVRDFQPEVTIVCSPNNPTGCVLGDDDLRSLLEATSGLVVVDEAYHEFAEHSVVPLLREHDNLVVLRTFSKAMAMAALRTGYLLAAPELTREIAKAVLPYNLNIVSQTAAEVAVEMYEDELRPLVRRIIAERPRLHEALSRIEGLTPVRSHANFILVRSAVDPGLVFAELLKRNILIRDVSGYPMLSDCFRVSVGTPEENDFLLESLREIFGAR